MSDHATAKPSKKSKKIRAEGEESSEVHKQPGMKRHQTSRKAERSPFSINRTRLLARRHAYLSANKRMQAEVIERIKYLANFIAEKAAVLSESDGRAKVTSSDVAGVLRLFGRPYYGRFQVNQDGADGNKYNLDAK